jgi:flagellar motor switch protein FliM
VIGRLVFPIGRVLAMAPDEVIALPQSALDAITLEASDGRRIARARLGQNRGMRALKISLAEAPVRAASAAAPSAAAPEVEPAVPAPVVPPEGLREAS